MGDFVPSASVPAGVRCLSGMKPIESSNCVSSCAIALPYFSPNTSANKRDAYQILVSTMASVTELWHVVSLTISFSSPLGMYIPSYISLVAVICGSAAKPVRPQLVSLDQLTHHKVTRVANGVSQDRLPLYMADSACRQNLGGADYLRPGQFLLVL